MQERYSALVDKQLNEPLANVCVSVCVSVRLLKQQTNKPTNNTNDTAIKTDRDTAGRALPCLALSWLGWAWLPLLRTFYNLVSPQSCQCHCPRPCPSSPHYIITHTHTHTSDSSHADIPSQHSITL